MSCPDSEMPSDRQTASEVDVGSLQRSDTVEYKMETGSQGAAETKNGMNEECKEKLNEDSVESGEPEIKKPRLEKDLSNNGQEIAHNGNLHRNKTVEHEMEVHQQNKMAEDKVAIAANKTDQVPFPLTKIPSVLQDAQLIASIIDGFGVNEIYEKLKEKRGNPNRVDIVMDEILESARKGRVPEEHHNDQSAALLGDFIKVIDKATANMESLPISADEIHNLLRLEGDQPDRVDRVVAKLLSRYYNNILRTDGPDLRADVRQVLLKLPGANPDEVYILLGERIDHPDRVKLVINFLQARTITKLARKDTLPDDPALRNDPLYRDMRIVAKIVPEADPNEIYAFLEALHDRKNRIQLVIEEMLKIVPVSHGSFSQESVDDLSSISGSFDSQPENTTVFPKIAYNIDDEVQDLQEIFPDCDPKYLYDELEKKQDDRDRVKNLAMTMFENKDYPKREDVAREKKKSQAKERVENLTFDMTDFLSKFPDPVTTFGNPTKNVSSNYNQHVMVQIYNEFKEYKKGFLTHVMSKNKFHYIPSRQRIKAIVKDLSENSRKLKLNPRKDEPFPDEPDEYFFYEKLYCAHEEEIKDFLQDQADMKELRKEQARENEELLECGCCFDDECLFEDMSSCADGHIFCKICIRLSAEVIIGSSQCDFPCLAGNCEYKFPLPVLQTVLPSNMFSILLRRLQEEEIKQAEIPDLISCPFCSFATIMLNPDDKVFKCLNPECLKDSCRLCREPNHVPKRCDEIEKQGETNMRTYIQTKVSEAMLRQCPRCKRYFFKEYGCNKMTCVCGTSMCYVCKAANIDYDHFDDDENIAEPENDRCGLYADVHKIHYQEMYDAAKAAEIQYIKDHPEADGMTLNYDIEEHINQMKAKIKDGDEEEDNGNDSDDYASGDDLSTDNEENWKDNSDYGSSEKEEEEQEDNEQDNDSNEAFEAYMQENEDKEKPGEDKETPNEVDKETAGEDKEIPKGDKETPSEDNKTPNEVDKETPNEEDKETVGEDKETSNEVDKETLIERKETPNEVDKETPSEDKEIPNEVDKETPSEEKETSNEVDKATSNEDKETP